MKTTHWHHRIKQWLGFIGLGLLSCSSAKADNSSSPFPSIDIGSGDVVNAVGGRMQTSMQYALIGGGAVMVLAGLGVIIHRLREDSNNRDSGNFLTTLVIAGLAVTIGLVLITIGWNAASFKVSS